MVLATSCKLRETVVFQNGLLTRTYPAELFAANVSQHCSLGQDGSVLLSEMQIQHPTASMIARAASAQAQFPRLTVHRTVMFIGELMKLAEQSLAEGLHPRLIAEAQGTTREETIHIDDPLKEREKLVCVARTSLRPGGTKIAPNLADPMAEVVVDAAWSLQHDQPLDLNMVEILHMKNKLVTDTRLIKGLVLDHGARHPDGASAYFTLKRSNMSTFQSHMMIHGGRACENKKSFVLINQKGIDPPSLEMLAHEAGIAACKFCLRRLPLAVGGIAVNSVDDLDVDDLGSNSQLVALVRHVPAPKVKHPQSCTILIQGSTDHAIAQMKDAIKDGLRAVQNCVEDEAIASLAALDTRGAEEPEARD
eukprot:Skav207584  [mRNA]  locus=scaffold2450:15282:27032:+ [translate_table: standard]